MSTKTTRMTLAANREHRASGIDYHLKVDAKYIDLLNSLPEFRDLSTEQLRRLLPPKYRNIIPPVGEFYEVRDHPHQREDRVARATIIGMLASEGLLEQHRGFQFLQRTLIIEAR